MISIHLCDTQRMAQFGRPSHQPQDTPSIGNAVACRPQMIPQPHRTASLPVSHRISPVTALNTGKFLYNGLPSFFFGDTNLFLNQSISSTTKPITSEKTSIVKILTEIFTMPYVYPVVLPPRTCKHSGGCYEYVPAHRDFCIDRSSYPLLFPLLY
jgi:hypothetical protein